MSNGDGLRVTLFVSGCEHECDGCHNPQTWSSESGIPFDEKAKQEIFDKLGKDYISGITISGGDPLHSCNLPELYFLLKDILLEYPDKTVWLYTGCSWEDIQNNWDNNICTASRKAIVDLVNVLVDGKFERDKTDVNYKWAGSKNQRVIDVQKSLKLNKVVLY